MYILEYIYIYITIKYKFSSSQLECTSVNLNFEATLLKYEGESKILLTNISTIHVGSLMNQRLRHPLVTCFVSGKKAKINVFNFFPQMRWIHQRADYRAEKWSNMEKTNAAVPLGATWDWFQKVLNPHRLQCENAQLYSMRKHLQPGTMNAFGLYGPFHLTEFFNSSTWILELGMWLFWLSVSTEAGWASWRLPGLMYHLKLLNWTSSLCLCCWCLLEHF